MILQGNCIDTLKTLDDGSVDCCITSPPYWGLRDYGEGEQLGLEKTPEEYVANMVKVFAEVKRVLKPEGTLWLNLGDSYAGGGRAGKDGIQKWGGIESGNNDRVYAPPVKTPDNLKPKDLVGIPWMTAFALRADGWWLRQDIIWHKPNPMPESVRDRCTKAHEYIFLMSKSQKYYCDMESIKEDAGETNAERPRMGQGQNTQYNQKRGEKKWTQDNKNNSQSHSENPVSAHQESTPKNITGNMSDRGVTRTTEGLNLKTAQEKCPDGKRNKRSVWTVTTKPYSEAHFATYPEKLIEPCVKAGCPEGGTILDPFFGAGTTGLVAYKNRRNYIGCELNPEYIKISEKRIQDEKDKYGLFE